MVIFSALGYSRIFGTVRDYTKTIVSPFANPEIDD